MRRDGEDEHRAAMEPARKGREHMKADPVCGGALAAAMEPARKGREHATTSARGSRGHSSRNGARPERAGAPWQIGTDATAYLEPQWSPPGKGGSTGQGH